MQYWIDYFSIALLINEENDMPLYKVTYDGLWMGRGGVAIVYADSEEGALSTVEKDLDTINFTNAKAEEIAPSLKVIYNYNGDY